MLKLNFKIVCSIILLGIVLCFFINAYSQTPPQGNAIGTVGAVRTLERNLFIDVTDSSKYKKGDRIFIRSSGSTLTVTVERVTSSYLVCSADLGTIRMIHAGDSAFTTRAMSAAPPPVKDTAEADSQKTDSSSHAVAEETEEPEAQPIPRQRETGPMYFSIYGKTDTSDYRRMSPIYIGQPGINYVGSSITFDSNRYGLDFYYAVPFAENRSAVPEELAGLGFFNIGLTDDHDVTLQGKISYHLLRDENKFETSSYTEESLSLVTNYFLRPSIAYLQRYYFNNYHGDRNALGDYTATFKLNPIRERYLNIDFAADYASEEYQDKKSTPENEGRKGLRDLYYDFRIIIEAVRFGYVYAIIPAHDWKKDTGFVQYDWYIDLLPKFGPLTINLRYDFIDQVKRHPEKTCSLFSASARLTF